MLYLHSTLQRIYSDFLMPSRLGDYHELLTAFVEAGYDSLTVRGFNQLLKSGKLDPQQKILVLRQDVDTDVATSRAMWQIERALEVKATRYFRWSTFDVNFMHEIESNRGEASYHFEEIATYAKKHSISSQSEIMQHIQTIRELFRENVKRMRELTMLPIETVASHGDFANRKLRLYNWEITKDAQLRRDLEIACETYDEELNVRGMSRFCDAAYPEFWDSGNPLEAIRRGDSIIYLLVHPRHWRANQVVNMRENLCRMWQGIRYDFMSATRRRVA